jgi:hypothetical protein
MKGLEGSNPPCICPLWPEDSSKAWCGRLKIPGSYEAASVFKRERRRVAVSDILLRLIKWSTLDCLATMPVLMGTLWIANLIGGRWIEPAGRKTLPVYNPASGEVIEQVPLSSGAEVDQTVAAAVNSFELWAATPVMERARLM